MSTKEQNRLQILNGVLERYWSMREAAPLLGVSERQGWRLLSAYQKEVLRDSDIITLHVPLTRRTRSMISDRELEMMKPTAFLVNCCRGPVVGEKALHRALTQGTIAAAGLDVLEEEPTPADNPRFDLDNVVITPHMAGPGEESTQRAVAFAYYNIGRVLYGEIAESLVTPE